MLARMKQDKMFTLGLARYGDDFAAIRDDTDDTDGDSVYHFVHTQAPSDMRVIWLWFSAASLLSGIRLTAPEYGSTFNVLFVGVTCAVKSFYAKQHRTLFAIIQDDSRDLGGRVHQSWFEAPTSDPVLVQGATDRDVLRIKEDISHIGGLGINIEFDVGMERRDTHDGHSTYAMYSAHYTLLSDETLPKRSVGYFCDRKGKRPWFDNGGKEEPRVIARAHQASGERGGENSTGGASKQGKGNM
ncbi:hypothetical protein DFH09DRAFT_1099570 [Mycena vulgaris]|nr:hypothetical protein DFH09DRAFT_1099570 [Mycena vulgaris]